MKNLSADLSLNELLSEIDYGPIEYCKMFETPAPVHFSDVETLKTCYISFINTQVLVSFHSKYGKNNYNLRALRDRLKNSKYLKITLNEPNHPGNGPLGNNNLSKQDYIKLKTLNYITEFNATRAVQVVFKVSDPELASDLETEFSTRCSKFGEVEDFQTVDEVDSTELLEIKFIVHFTSIDAAIKIYEYHLKRIQIDHLNLIDLEGSEQLPSKCTSVTFQKDRCDRTELLKSRHSVSNGSLSRVASSSSSSSNGSSPSAARRMLPRQAQLVQENGEKSNGQDPEYHRREKSISPLHYTSIQEEEDDEIPPAENKISEKEDTKTAGTEKDIVPEGVKALPELHRRDSSPLSKPQKNSANSSSYGNSKSLSSSNPSDSTDTTHTRSRRYTSDPYMFALQSQLHLSHPNLSNGGVCMGMPPSHNFNPDPYNMGNRTLYLGNLHPDTTVEEIANNVRAGGLVESIKYHKAKRVCFITFIDAAIALKFFLNHQVLHQLIIHKNEVVVSWAKNHSGQLPRDIALAVTVGASRNVYIGVKPSKDSLCETKIEIPDEKTLRKDFSVFGEMEQINFYHNKDCGFINFMNISAAIKVVELFESNNANLINSVVQDNGEFYEKYKDYKISFGKDRCGNPPKFSYKKKSVSREYLRERELVDMPLPQSDILPEEEIGQITDEAALVFGISTDANPHAEIPEPNDVASPPSEYLAESTALEVSSEDEGQFPPQEVENKPHGDDSASSSFKPQLQNDDIVQALDIEDPLAGSTEVGANNDDEDEEEDEDEDDISIIIGSDVTNDAPVHKRHNRKHNRVYQHRSDLTEGFHSNWNNSRNSSALSLNSSYGQNYNYHPASFSPGPISQPVFYQQVPQFVQPMRSNSFYGVPQVAPMPQPQLVYHASIPGPSINKGHPQAFSGSQVMAQYLAKSRHENFIYASSILNNDVTTEEIREFRKSSRRSSRKSEL